MQKNLNKNFNLFLFDLDGTLLDTAREFHIALNEVLDKENKPYIPSNDIDNYHSELEKIVIQSGGKIYLAKDMLMSKESFEASYKSLDSFATFRDPNISSQMSKRLFGDSIG